MTKILCQTPNIPWTSHVNPRPTQLRRQNIILISEQFIQSLDRTKLQFFSGTMILMCLIQWMCTVSMTPKPPCWRLRAVQSFKAICRNRLEYQVPFLASMEAWKGPGEDPLQGQVSNTWPYWALISTGISLIKIDFQAPRLFSTFSRRLANWCDVKKGLQRWIGIVQININPKIK